MSDIKISVISYEQYTDYDFIDPATYYVVNALQEYVYFHTSKREVAQNKADDMFGKGRYTVKASKIVKTKSKQENGGYSAR